MATTLQGFVASRAAKGASVYTDQAAGYKGMPFEHERSITQSPNTSATKPTPTGSKASGPR